MPLYYLHFEIPNPIMTRPAQLFLFFALLFLLLLGRLVQVQLIQGEKYFQKAKSRKDRVEFIPGRRGRILDRRGVILAQDQGVFALSLVPSRLDPAINLALLLGGTKKTLGKFWKAQQEEESLSWEKISPQKASHILRVQKSHPRLYAGVNIHLGENSIRLSLGKIFLQKRKEIFATLSHLLKKSDFPWESKWKKLIQRALKEKNLYTRKILLRSPQVFISPLSLPLAHRIEIALLPGVEITTTSKRLYPHREETWHLLGYLGPLNRKDYRRLKREGKILRPISFGVEKNLATLLKDGYFLDEKIGKRGLEKIFESHLRSKKGIRVMEINYRNQLQKVLKKIPPQGGKDLVLTLDMALQKSFFQGFKDLEKQVQQGLLKTRSGHVSGAAVAIDPATGEVFALVSYPSVLSSYKKLSPYFHRPLAGRYPPGSIFKPLMAVAFLQIQTLANGKKWQMTPEDEVVCRHRYNNSRFFKCLGYHGPTSVRRALQKSCNIYFYTYGEKMGGQRLAHWAGLFGLGEKTGLEIGGEKVGTLASPKWKWKRYHKKWWPGDSRNFAIGQGYLTVTPVGICRALAVLFNGGKVLQLHLIKGKKKKVVRSLSLSPKSLTAVQQGMKMVAEPGGTASRAGFGSFEVALKTGSAQDGRGFNFAWIAGAAWGKKGQPSYPAVPPIVFVVLVEHTSGHGGSTAGPLAVKMLQVFFGNRK